MSTDPRYPVGKFVMPESVTPEELQAYVARIRTAPARLAELVRGMSWAQLDTPYREGGWTVRQVVHHLPDSHMQAYSRMKMALTEEEPLIKPYDEAAWAQLPDSVSVPVETSLCLLDCLHKRWVAVMETLTVEQWQRTFRHPEIGLLRLEVLAALYAWHSDHHIGHVMAVAGM